MAVFLERDLHHTLVVCEQRLVAVTEVETPYFDVLVSRAGDEELRIAGNVHGQYGKLQEVNPKAQHCQKARITLCPYKERKNLRVS